MKRFLGYCVMLWGWTATLYANSVEFPLGWYSFADIAQRMSVEGRKVVCSPELQSRMALLSIKPREWEKMRTLLERSLDIEIILENPEQKRWRLTRDSQVVKQEKVLRKQLATLLEEEIQNKFQRNFGARSVLFELLPLPTLQQELPLLSSLVSEFRKHLANTVGGDVEIDTVTPEILTEALRTWTIPPLPQSLQRWSREAATLSEKEFEWLFGEGVPRLSEMDEENRSKITLLTLGLTLEYFRAAPLAVWLSRQCNPSWVVAAIEHGLIWQSMPLNFMDDSALEWFLGGEERGSKGRLPALSNYPRGVAEYKWRLGSGELTLTRRLIVIKRNGYSIVSTEVVYVDTKDDSLQQLFAKMDSEYHSNYVQATQRHWQLLKEAPHQGRHDRQEGAQNLYWLIRDWAEATRQEVVIEMYPHRALLGTFPSKKSLEDIASSLRDKGVWRVEQIEGVWVWRNWLAFVDRVPDLPLKALHRLVSSARTPADWRHFVQKTTPTQAKWLTLVSNLPNAETLFGNTEWLGTLPFVARQWLLFRLIDRVPNWESRLRLTGVWELQLGSLGVATLRRWVSELLQIGGEVFSDEGWEVCVWSGQTEGLATALGESGYLRISIGRTVSGEVLLEQATLIGVSLPVNFSKQK